MPSTQPLKAGSPYQEALLHLLNAYYNFKGASNIVNVPLKHLFGLLWRESQATIPKAASGTTTPSSSKAPQDNIEERGFNSPFQPLLTMSKTIPSCSRSYRQLSHLFSTPTWSVRSLLPSTTSSTPTITPKQLHHLLRLSALPQPPSPAAEASMIATLESQLHFVRAIQQVDTTGVEPLRSIRDETAAGVAEATISVERLKEALEKEETWGHCRRPRRRRDLPVDTAGSEDWDALGTASQKVGRYFVVKSGKGVGAQETQ
jgi:Asp-tRNA(Asn)/Glu-tRNA(Gln) amidotransferase C subunit